MFTGIVTTVGSIASATPKGDGLRLRIDAPGLGMDDVALGDSIAIQGVCHTVVAKDARGFEARGITCFRSTRPRPTRRDARRNGASSSCATDRWK